MPPGWSAPAARPSSASGSTPGSAASSSSARSGRCAGYTVPLQSFSFNSGQFCSTYLDPVDLPWCHGRCKCCGTTTAAHEGTYAAYLFGGNLLLADSVGPRPALLKAASVSGFAVCVCSAIPLCLKANTAMRALTNCRCIGLAAFCKPFVGGRRNRDSRPRCHGRRNSPFRDRDARLPVLVRRRPGQPRPAAVRVLLEGAVRQRQLPRALAAQVRRVRSMPSVACRHNAGLTVGRWHECQGDGTHRTLETSADAVGDATMLEPA